VSTRILFFQIRPITVLYLLSFDNWSRLCGLTWKLPIFFLVVTSQVQGLGLVVVQCEMTRRKTQKWTNSILSPKQKNKQKSGVIVPPNNDNRLFKKETKHVTHLMLGVDHYTKLRITHSTREWHIKGGCSLWNSWHYYTEHQSHLRRIRQSPRKWSFHAACHWCCSLRLQPPKFTPNLLAGNFYKARPIPLLLLSLPRLPRPQRLFCCKLHILSKM